MHLSVIIPAKNEEKHIQKTVQSVFAYLSSKNVEHEIIVVTNNTTDQTQDIVRGLMATVPTLKLLDYLGGRGKGLAVRKGILQATGRYRLFMDADNATTIDQIEDMMLYLEQGYGIVIGSIAVKGHHVEKGSEPLWRVLFGKLGNKFIQVIAVPGIHDTQRGFKILTAEAAERIFSKMTIDGFAFDIEMLALARKFGYCIKEVPVRWHNDPNTSSHPRLSSYFDVLLDTVHVRWNLLTGKYS